MKNTRIGYARCSTDTQDLTGQRAALIDLGVPEDRIYTDHGLTGRNRDRPGLDQALAATRAGDTLVVTKLDRLARSVPDARAIADQLQVARSNWPSAHQFMIRLIPWGKCSSTSSRPSPSSRAT